MTENCRSQNLAQSCYKLKGKQFIYDTITVAWSTQMSINNINLGKMSICTDIFFIAQRNAKKKSVFKWTHNIKAKA